LVRRWKEGWNAFRERQDVKRSVAVEQELLGTALKLRKRLTAPEASLLIQMRSGSIGLRDFLHRRNVPGFTTPDCPCGEDRHTPAHVLVCERYWEGREEMFREVKTRDLEAMLTSSRKFKKLAKWWFGLGLQAQWGLTVAQATDWERRHGERAPE